MVAFANVECAAVHCDAFDDAGDINVGVRVAVAVGVGGKVVRNEVTADLDELRDRFAVIAGHAGRKILWGLDAAGSGLDGIAGNGNRCAGSAGIGIQQIGAGENLNGGIGRLDRDV